MNLYALCLIVIVVLQVLLAIFVFVYNRDIQNAAFRGWDRLWAGRAQSEINSRVIDEVQRSLECCGSTSFLDYGKFDNSMFDNSTIITLILHLISGINVPGSCCNPDSDYCNQLTAYRTGCKTQIRYYVENYASWIAYLSIVMAIIEVSESFFCFSSTIDNFCFSFSWLVSCLAVA